MPRLQTFMSPVCCRQPVEGATAVPEISQVHRVDNENERLYWLDEMLGGGLEIPDDIWSNDRDGPAFLLVLAGPPGTGKSTFALELCYNLARFRQPVSQTSLRSLYVSSEWPSSRIIENASSFNWDEQYFRPYEPGRPLTQKCCTIYGAEQVERSTGIGKLPSATDFFDTLNRRWVSHIATRNLEDLVTWTQGEETRVHDLPVPPEVVVIDSLNILGTQVYSSNGVLNKSFEEIMKWIGEGTHPRPQLLILVIDGFSGNDPSNPWEFMADAAFRFEGAVGPEGYYQRTFQIVKIKTQSHAWGKHGFKILSGGVAGARRPKYSRTKDTPYLPTGGTFIFPTVHWHLSQSIRDEARTRPHLPYYPTPLRDLNSILGTGDNPRYQGFPGMHTTALVGRRGGMKSHLAYDFMLSHALGAAGDDVGPKNVLLVSLRDDLEAAIETLAEIGDQQELLPPATESRDAVRKLLESDRIEIIYNWPGFVTPGEFFHRIFVALTRTRQQRAVSVHKGELAVPHRNTAEIVVLNGLDHLEAKFPLCASEKVFIPALVSLFRCYKVCSVVISAEGGRSIAPHEIGAMADLILEFTDPTPSDLGAVALGSEIWQKSKVEAVRVPAGQIGGLWGILGRKAGGAMSFFRVEPGAQSSSA